ncbi:MAG: TonB C-terminal domain-containing protein [Candidatus Scalindua sediminis]|nr:TonB C-terminal domain-containing protein [Candidatus Scalindua sediminis]
MFPRLYFNTESKTIFAYFLAISFLLHLIFVFSSSSLSHLTRSGFDINDYVSKKDNYVIEIELESGREDEKSIAAEEKSEEEEKAEEDFPEEKRQLFVDTSDKVIDEEPQADTDKIGEKGSIAKDMYSGEDNINDEPRLEGDSDFPGEVPDELASTVPQESGFPIEVSSGEPTRDVSEEITQPLVEEEIIDSLSDVDNSETLPVNNEVETFDELQDEAVVQDAKLDDVKDTSSQVEDIDKIESTTPESDVVILETESFENMETETDVIEESTDKITESVEEYTEIASIPKTMIKEIVEGSKESVSNKVQSEFATPESQIINIPTGNDAPFFEDNISNALIQGEQSFNIKKHEYAPYYKTIRDKISWYWLLQYGTDASINLVTNDYKPVIVEFKVLPSGKIVNVVITNSAGNELLASKIQKSVQNTVLNKFPEYVNEEHINVRFNFYFF